jgi:cytochrome c biogenesis protein ResB
MFKKIHKNLSSLRFTLFLICLIGVMFMLGLWIPQKSIVMALYTQWKTNTPALVAFLDALKLTTIYSSPLMLTIWGLFFLNLSLVMWQRIPLIKSRITMSDKKLADPLNAAGFPFRASYQMPTGLDTDSLLKFLRTRGYRALREGDRFYAVKNRLSPIAFGLFHISFFFILLGGLTSIYTKFTGLLDLAEGEVFQGELERYVPVPTMPKIGSPPQVAFKVIKIIPLVSGDTPTGIRVQLVDPENRLHEVNVNSPYNVASTSFVFKDLGVAPLFVINDPSGKELDGAFVKLNVVNGKADSFDMSGFHFQVRFYPDFADKDGKPVTLSREFKNPAFTVIVERDGKTIANGVILRNGSLNFAGYRLQMKEMPFYARFLVIKEYGIPILYAGFALASLAVFWRFMLYRREIVGAFMENGEGRILQVAGRSEFYKSLAEDEFTGLFNDALGLSKEN